MDCFCAKPHMIQIKIILLDEQELFHEVQDVNTGQTVFDIVTRHLNLLETAYFGLRYLDLDGQTHWLDLNKKLHDQLKGQDPFTLYFCVKFYAADPCKLLEEITRYQFFLQIKQDVLQGRLPVTFDIAAELGAYIVQSELGDYDPRRHSPGYVSEFRFLPNQTIELENRIAELHKTLVGQLPSIAELKYLDKIKWLDMYGVDLHPVLGEDNQEYYLGLTPSGIIVLRNKNIVGNYYWPRISKIYFKGRYFMLRVTGKNNDESTYGFETPTKPACKHLWRCCIEHHAFFRLVQVSPTSPDIFSLGSRFTYSGRTEKQAIHDAQMKIRSQPSFSRIPSRRYQRRIDSSLESQKLDDSHKPNHYQSQEIKHVSIPQPAQSFDSPYKSTCNSAIETRHMKSDSPRSTRSAPWSQPHSRGLYNVSVPPSPRSIHSAGPRYRSSSVDSQSSNDSRSCKRRRNHRNRWISDNESEFSKCSGRSHRKHRKHHSRGKHDSGSDPDLNCRVRCSSNNHLENHYELVDSGSQWQEVQKKKQGHFNTIQQASVISSNRRSGYVNSGMETESEPSCHHNRRRHRKHRSRSKSPAENKTWLPEELKKHLEFNLVDTSGMSEKQLREIPYTVVQTNHAKQLKLKHHHMGKVDALQGEKLLSYSPPPPYSPKPYSSDLSKSHDNNLHVKEKSSQHDQDMQLEYHSKLKSLSQTSISQNTNLLSRMFKSLGLSEANGHVSSMGQNDNIDDYHGHKIRQYLDNGIGPYHEHTDSGLGVEQDYLYTNERSNNINKEDSNVKSNNDHGIPIYTPVSKFSSDIINPNEYYPSNSHKYKSNASALKYDTVEHKLKNNIVTNVNKMNMNSRFGNVPNHVFMSQPSKDTIPSSYKAAGPYCSSNSTNARGSKKFPRLCNNYSNSMANDITGAVEKATPSLSSNSDCSKLPTNYCSTLSSGCSRGAAADMYSTHVSGKGPLRVQYQSQLMQSSIDSRASSRSESWSAENSNLIYNNNFYQLLNSNQNNNNLHISNELKLYNDILQEDQRSNLSHASNHDKDVYSQGTDPEFKTGGETSEMSTEL